MLRDQARIQCRVKSANSFAPVFGALPRSVNIRVLIPSPPFGVGEARGIRRKRRFPGDDSFSRVNDPEISRAPGIERKKEVDSWVPREKPRLFILLVRAQR